MSDEELNRFIEPYVPHLVTTEATLDYRLLLALCREIERNARHQATRSAWALANAIDSGVDVKALLEKHT